MFNKKFEDRLRLWSSFRDTLTDAEDPLQDTINLFNSAPITSIATDPYDSTTWPTPWQIIQENEYCKFVKLLAICYTLQLSDRFSESSFVIYIASTKEMTHYLLYVDDLVVGYEHTTYVHKSKVENTIIETKYVMPSIN